MLSFLILLFTTFWSFKAGYSGMIIVQKEIFSRILYNENMKGWGLEDHDFKNQVLKCGLKEKAIDTRLATHLKHDDTLRTKHYLIKDKSLSEELNKEFWRD